MTKLDPIAMLSVGFLLMVMGVALPMLMIVKIIESTFFLNFLAYSASLVGLILGMLGIMSIVARNRNRRQ
jgi:hypothetical protein